ncbi:MAG TPA: ferritin-like domain-containing protein [Oligoflexus sp.]|uniref:ferritin-like domain-containing protein n=1 Tax=Oligoflexus sp. TaxID=1971216 RepID=UPI002D417A1C|nr:ferritin-like domain-containing protein [Oligoflexus sp.]HYX34149.1 ferritin-like domain-containing protein [Oligoflexus sp.]
MTHLEPTMGKNRTGAQMSPLMSAAMLESIKEFPWDTVQPTADSAERIRLDYAKDAHAIGSIPMPLTLKGMARTGYEKIKGEKPEIFIDKLGERMAFERMGVRLYQALIRKCEMDPARHASMDLYRLQQICDSELEHMQMLKQAIEAVGADPTATTPGADAMAVASMGLGQVLNDPRTSVTQCLEAILIAELADTDGWQLLIDLTQETGDETMLAQFQRAMQEEEVHVLEIRSLLKELTLGKTKL